MLLPAVRAAEPPEPVDARTAIQGTCPKNQVSTARGCLTPPEIVKKSKVFPKYPEAARKQNIPATVKLDMIVELDGTVSNVVITSSTVQGAGFEEATAEAVKKWRYTPGTIAGHPVRVLNTVTMTFMTER